LGPISVITVPEQVVFPIDAFLPSIDQQVAMALQGQRLVDECVQVNGGSGHFMIGNLPDGQPDIGGFRGFAIGFQRIRVTEGIWGIFDPDWMRQEGYRQRRPDAVAGDGFSFDPIMDACIRAVGALSPTGAAAMPFSLRDLPDGGPQWNPDDSRWRSAEAEWSKCMAGRGCSYADPYEAAGANGMAANLANTSEQDRAAALAVAVADLDCKLETNLVGKGLAIQSAYDQIYIDAHRDELAALQTRIAAFLAAGVEALTDLGSLPTPTPWTPAPS
jgi:hypothetical protein